MTDEKRYRMRAALAYSRKCSRKRATKRRLIIERAMAIGLVAILVLCITVAAAN